MIMLVSAVVSLGSWTRYHLNLPTLIDRRKKKAAESAYVDGNKYLIKVGVDYEECGWIVLQTAVFDGHRWSQTTAKSIRLRTY